MRVVGLGEPGSFSSSAVGCPCLCSSKTETGQCDIFWGLSKRMFKIQCAALVMVKDVINLDEMN